MYAELLELQRQLEAAQSAKSSVRLSERNVVELVQKLQERGIIDFDLLHTVSGKEYITSVRALAPFPTSSLSLFVPSTLSLWLLLPQSHQHHRPFFSRLVRFTVAA